MHWLAGQLNPRTGQLYIVRIGVGWCWTQQAQEGAKLAALPTLAGLTHGIDPLGHPLHQILPRVFDAVASLGVVRPL